jgi:hypothetical protein
MLISGFSMLLARPRRAPTAADYVQQGLLAMWDAASNRGLGQPHNPSATSWANCVAGAPALAVTYTDPSAAPWRGGIRFTAVGAYAKATSSALLTLLSKLEHWECAFAFGDPDAPGSSASPINADTRIVFARQSANNADKGWIALGSTTKTGDGRNLLAHRRVEGKKASSLGNDKPHTASVNAVQRHAVIAARLDGESLAFDANDGSGAFGTGLGVGITNLNNNARSVGSVYCLRLYSRALTAAEVAANAAIDRVRFGIS